MQEYKSGDSKPPTGFAPSKQHHARLATLHVILMCILGEKADQYKRLRVLDKYVFFER